MEHRRFVFKRGLKELLKNNITDAEREFKRFHDLVNNHPVYHPLSHIALIGLAVKKRDGRSTLEHTWLALCAPIASIRNIFVQSRQ